MFLITNREVFEGKTGFDAFGECPNPKGPHELRFVRVSRSSNKYRVSVLKDKLDPNEIAALDLDPDRDPDAAVYRGKQVARDIYKRITATKKNLVLFVHGFNNDVEAVVKRAYRLQDTYGVEVLAFTWPANGGGAKGAMSYRSDKKDARASIGALDRVIENMRRCLSEIRESQINSIREEIRNKHSLNAETRDEVVARRVAALCPFRVTLMLHSMGNYLYKQLLKSSLYSAGELLFDNVVLVAADTNNKDHASWVDRVEFRNRLYITINEKDSALKWSRMKGGDEQRARLGHLPYQLDSERATYVNFTGTPYVRESHAYFEGPATKNDAVKQFFNNALNGNVAEARLNYNVSRNYFEPK